MTYTLRDGRTITTSVIGDGKTLFELKNGDDLEAYVALPHAEAADLVEEVTR